MKKYTAHQILTQNGFQENLAICINEKQEFIKYDVVDDETIKLDGILTPGWVNSHAHLEFSHLKGKIEPHQGMADFIEKIQSLRGESFITEAKNTVEKLVNEGCVLWVDTMNNIDFQNYNDLFELDLNFLVFFECLGLSESRANYFLDHFEQLKIKNPALQITFHSPYSCGDYVISEVLKKADVLSIHLSESKEEIDLLAKNQGKLVELFEKWGIWQKMENRYPFRHWFWEKNKEKSKRIIWVHNTEIEDIVLRGDEYFCLCPGANEFLHQTFPNPKKFSNVKNRILIGTDSAAGNKEISLLYEIKMMLQAGFNLEETLMALTWNASVCWNIEQAGFYEGKKVSLVNYFPDKNVSLRLLIIRP